METIKYSRAAWKSAKLYFDYLKRTGKGRDVINVLSIERLDTLKFKLFIAKKTPYIDSLEIRIRCDGSMIELKERDAKIVAYEERAKYVIVATSARGSNYFSNVRPESVTLESDLTFLVKNVMKWYTQFHDFIELPRQASYDVADISAPEGASFEQYDSLRTILESKVSYIWGAPGTGKTQMVLSNAILHYINNDDRVLVLAPTNNALEQSLRGVMKVFDNKSISRNSVIRLGKATNDFLIEYPEICEAGHYDNLATTLKKDLIDLEEQFQEQGRYLILSDAFKTFSKIALEYESTLSELADLKKLLESFEAELNTISQSKLKAEKHTDELSQNVTELLQQETNQKRYLLIIEQHSHYQKIVDAYHANVSKLTSELQSWEAKHDQALKDVSAVQDNLREKERALVALQKAHNSFFSKLKYCFSRTAKEKAEKAIFDATQNVSILSDRFLQLMDYLGHVKAQISNTSDSLTRAHRIKSGSPELFEISSTLFCKPMPLQELSKAFDKEFSRFEGFTIDTELQNKIEVMQVALTDAQNKTAALTDQETNLKIKVQEYDQKVHSISQQVSLHKAHLKLISAATFANDFDYEQLKTAFENELNQFDGFVVDEDLPQKLEKKKEQYQTAIFHLKDIAGNKCVVACTVDYAIMHFDELLDGIAVNVAHVFMDEAAYCPLIKAAVCFSFAAPVTLLGDHMQLPPICEMDKKAICAAECNQLIFLWDLSAIYFPDIFCYHTELDDLYTSYITNDSPVYLKDHTAFLTKTFRFGESLAAILDNFVYKQGFKGDQNKETEITVINVPRSSSEPSSHQSIGEAKAIAEYIGTHKLDDFVVLSPYRKQRDLIGKLTKLPPDSVLTIHASQGREWDTVIISVTDVWDKFFMSSLNIKSNGLRIVNTAVSRARQNLVLVLDYDHWKHCHNELVAALANAYTELI